MLVGLTYTFEWYDIGDATLQISRDGGDNWSTIAANVITAQPSYPDLWACSYAWTITGPASSNCKLKIIDNSDSSELIGETFEIVLPEISGAVQSQPATTSGTVSPTISISGSVQAQRATSTGSISVEGITEISGSVQGQPATTTGSVSPVVSISGSVQGRAATTTGTVAPQSSGDGSFSDSDRAMLRAVYAALVGKCTVARVGSGYSIAYYNQSDGIEFTHTIDENGNRIVA